jgi:hypothetical protein
MGHDLRPNKMVGKMHLSPFYFTFRLFRLPPNSKLFLLFQLKQNPVRMIKIYWAGGEIKVTIFRLQWVTNAISKKKSKKKIEGMRSLGEPAIRNEFEIEYVIF